MPPRFGSPEYLKAREAAIVRIVASAPPPTGEQIVTLRRIFAGAPRVQDPGKSGQQFL